MTVAKEKGGDDDQAVLRSDIERTRHEMSRTVNAIEERLSPAHFKEQITSVKEHLVEQIREAKAELVGSVHDAKENIKGDIADGIHDASARVRAATVGKVEHMVDDARHMVHDAGETMKGAGSSMIDTIKENPIPAALVALGLGWLFMSNKRRMSEEGGSYRGAGYEDVPRRRRRGPRRLVQKGARAVETAAHDVGQRVQTTARDALHGAEHAAQEVGHSASHVAHDASAVGRRVFRQAGKQALRAERSVESTLRENPLALGAIAIAIGAAIGLALPHTEKEDQLMGAAKEKLLGKAEDIASNALHGVEDKAESAFGGDEESQPPSKKRGGEKPNLPNGTPARM